PERDRGRPPRGGRLRGRVPRDRVAARGHGRAARAGGVRADPRRARTTGGATHRDAGAPPRAHRRASRARARARRHAAPHRVQGPPRDRRPRPLSPGPRRAGGAAGVNDLEMLAREIAAGSVRALARGLTWVEAGGERAEALAERLFPQTGRAHVVGVTGSPGSGKSTLVRALAPPAPQRGRTRGGIGR